MTNKRLIESAFPLEQVSLDSVHEKNVRHGHISTLHIWPARRPLAACRAALIATLLPDGGGARERQAVYRRLAGTVVETVEDERVDGQTVARRKRDSAGGDAARLRGHGGRRQTRGVVRPEVHAGLSDPAWRGRPGRCPRSRCGTGTSWPPSCGRRDSPAGPWNASWTTSASARTARRNEAPRSWALIELSSAASEERAILESLSNQVAALGGLAPARQAKLQRLSEAP